jgi:hypothetical protein
MRVRGVEASDALDFSGKTVYGDFRDVSLKTLLPSSTNTLADIPYLQDLVKDGFAVVKAMSSERAAEHANAFHTYMEDL